MQQMIQIDLIDTIMQNSGIKEQALEVEIDQHDESKEEENDQQKIHREMIQRMDKTYNGPTYVNEVIVDEYEVS